MRLQHLLGGIRGKLVLSFSLLVAAIAVFVLAFFPARLERQAMASLESKAAAIRDITAYGLSAALVFGDTLAVEEVLSGASRAGGVHRLEVRDAHGGTIATYTADPIADAVSNPERESLTFVTTAPVQHGTTTVGELVVEISLAPLRGTVKDAQRLGLLVGAIILAIGCLIVYAVSTHLTRPLTAVAETVQRIAAGDLTLRAQETSDVEVSRFVRAFNKMVDGLAGAQALLSEMNTALERRVEQRTEELRRAVVEQERVRLALEWSESQARTTSELLQALIDVAPQAIMAVDGELRVTRWNKAAEQLLGWTADEVLGKRLPYTPAEAMEAFSNARAASMAIGRVHNVEVQRTRKDGTRVSVLLSVSALRDAGGHPLGYIAVLTDLTERKSLEEQLRQSQKMEAIGRLAGGIAHDFNNVLTVITSSATMLMDDAPTPELRQDVESILTSAKRASALTRQLLMFSRRQVLQPQSVRMNDVVAGMQPMLRRLVREDIQFQVELDDRVHSVQADPAQLEQVLLNLVLNAADAMPQGGLLQIATEHQSPDAEALGAEVTPAGGWTVLSVRDTGIGMDEATRERIFEPFFTTKQPGQGTGLGLATTYAVVTQLGGHIRVKTALGEGSEFRICMPACASPSAPEVEAPRAAPLQRGRATVLLVEDEDAVRRGLKRGLERLGYTVVEAEDGQRGLEIARELGDTVDVVVSDVMMPRMNGRALADRLLTERPGLPVIFMSGYTGEEVNRQGLVDSTHAFLQKPFELPQLGTTIEEMMRQGGVVAA